MRSEPTFALPAHALSETPEDLDLWLLAYEADSHDAQLCFGIFCEVWDARGPQPEALQFLRRALELSPGHGKSHMTFPHAAKNPKLLGHHSRLEFLLLPGSSFAATNYALWLARHDPKSPRREAVIRDGIERDPRDPGGYYPLIDLLEKQGRISEASATVKDLMRLFEPIFDPRARYCLEQNPIQKQQLESGQYDPAR